MHDTTAGGRRTFSPVNQSHWSPKIITSWHYRDQSWGWFFQSSPSSSLLAEWQQFRKHKAKVSSQNIWRAQKPDWAPFAQQLGRFGSLPLPVLVWFWCILSSVMERGVQDEIQSVYFVPEMGVGWNVGSEVQESDPEKARSKWLLKPADTNTPKTPYCSAYNVPRGFCLHPGPALSP